MKDLTEEPTQQSSVKLNTATETMTFSSIKLNTTTETATI